MIEPTPDEGVCAQCHASGTVQWFHYGGHSLLCDCQVVQVRSVCLACVRVVEERNVNVGRLERVFQVQALPVNIQN